MAPQRYFQGPAMAGKAPEIIENGDEWIVRGISVMTEGPAEGHFLQVGDEKNPKEVQIYCDEETINSLIVGAAKYQNGVKTKADHGSGIADVIGYLTSFAKGKTEDGKVKATADWHVLKSTPNVAHLLDIVRKLSDAVGFSAFFDGPFQVLKDQAFHRVENLYSIDFVTDPAANPSGMFARKVDNPSKPNPATKDDITMTPEELASACSAAMKPHMDAIHERLSKLEGNVMPRGVPTAQTASPAHDEDAMYSRFSAKIMPEISKAVTSGLQDTAKTLHALGLTPGTVKPSVSGPEPKDPAKMTFTELVEAAYSLESNQHLQDYEVIRQVALANPTQHRAALEKNELGRMPRRSKPYRAAAA